MEDKKYIIYGAGRQGKAYFSFLQSKGLDADIIGFCDKCYDEIKYIADKKVFSYDEARKQDAGFVVAVGNKEDRNEVFKMMDADKKLHYSIAEYAGYKGMNRVDFNREFCAFYHIDEMDRYFNSAESAVHTFWDDESVFKKMFMHLDLENVIELACGRGRHVPQYIAGAGTITLVDILAKNIDFCKDRFKNSDNIKYYQNNGYNLEKLKENTYTALFCYDAMVHFEMLDIYQYLLDIYRVLVHGGKALLHHSNNDKDYKGAFDNSVGGRSFMNKDIFAYLAYRAGFEILEQKVIDWGQKDLDCVTLIQKPFS